MSLSLEPAGLERAEGSARFLQSGTWGRFKAEFGWRPRAFALGISEGPAAGEYGLLLLERRLARGFAMAYVPHGPDFPYPGADAAAGLLAELSAALKPHLSREVAFIRFDPPWEERLPLRYAAEEGGTEKVEAPSGAEPLEAAVASTAPASPLSPSAGAAPRPAAAAASVPRPPLGHPLRRARADVQPPDTVLLDLSPSEDQLLAAMKPKWRYNIKLASKKGVEVARLSGAAALEALPAFYALYRETGERDRIALHPESYYRRLFELGAEAPGFRLSLWTARHEGSLLAAIVTLFRGEEAVYLYGASSNEKRNLMPAYALQWAAIRAAKAEGARVYDFFGIPPTGEPGHPMEGLYRFKTGFGGEIAHRAGSWDFPLKPLAYDLFGLAERARSWYFKGFKKRR